MFFYRISSAFRPKPTAFLLAGLILVVCVVQLPTCAAQSATGPTTDKQVEQWGIFEIELTGPADGNPFVDVELSASFQLASQTQNEPTTVRGFYDGDGTYRIRFMPSMPGSWEYITRSNRPALNGKRGSFIAVAASKNNHGPVRVCNTYHFSYADGTAFYPFGTTCYAWIHQSAELQQQTLDTLARSPFNKVRMCVFPSDHNPNTDILSPYVGTAPNHWDFTRFNPAFFRHLEQCVSQLGQRGVEAELILFHPYDKGRWGFDRMPAAADDLYLRYIVARLAAYRNVWWSLANEYDLLKQKKGSDWDRFFEIIAHDDPYAHLRSIHNCARIYNNTNPLVTHASIQNGSAVEDIGRAEILRDVYRKPIIYDEVKYEGDLPVRWGNLSPQELTHRFWVAIMAGTYATHGETYRLPDGQVAWTSGGGVLRGQSPARIGFLKKIVEQGPSEGINPIDKWQDLRTAGKPNEYYLVYFGKESPREWTFSLPISKPPQLPMKFRAEIIDGWNMTITPVEGVFEVAQENQYRYNCPSHPTIELPGRPYIALRITRIHDGEKQTASTPERNKAAANDVHSAEQATTPILHAADFAHYVDKFNALDEKRLDEKQAVDKPADDKQTGNSDSYLIPNDQAWDWIVANAPLFNCPDVQLEETYYFRWWTYRKHIEQMPVGRVVTEFLQPVSHAGPYNTISCAFGHHLAEGRWLRDQSPLNEYTHFWFHSGEESGPAKHFHQYSSWAAAALYDRYLVTGDRTFLVNLLDDLVADYARWEAERCLPNGLFWQYDVRDGMEESISGGRHEKNIRPTINSYMAANARAIARIATLADRPDVASEFNAKFETLRAKMIAALWDPDAKFFKVQLEHGGLSDAREEIGFIPWMFNLVQPQQAVAWGQLVDPAGFKAPCGITTAEQRHPKFRSHGTGNCEWDGAVWPFATSQTLTGLANLLRGPEQPYVTRRDYFDALVTYSRSQQMNGEPYIGEYLDEKTGQWLITGPKAQRSRDYNHSTFNDLVISGLAGLVPREDDTIKVDPLLPADAWDWFCLDGVPYHGRSITIMWDRTGQHYGHGIGLAIWADGIEIGRSPTLARLTAKLPAPGKTN
jgi:hypothetical protein